MTDYAIIEQHRWPDQLAQLVISNVASADGPIMLYAEDDVGGSMATSIIFEREGRLTTLDGDELEDVALAVHELYLKWGGTESDIRGLLFVIRGEQFSARFIYVADFHSDQTSYDRTVAHIREVFGREWDPPQPHPE